MPNPILIANPGSSSRKYSLYRGATLLSSLHFEYESEQIICTKTDFTEVQPVENFGDNSDTNSNHNSRGNSTDNFSKTTTRLPQTYPDFLAAAASLPEIWHDHLVAHSLHAILIRTVATGDYFTSDHIVDDQCLAELQKVAPRMPLHIPPVLTAIDEFRQLFPTTPIALISDSAFHADRPAVSRYYAIDPDLADRHQIKRYGAHGLSVESVVHQLRQAHQLPARLIVCHLGSGCSVTAVKDGKSFDTSMGYTPLEGVMMATRSGSLDPAAVLALQHILPKQSDHNESKQSNATENPSKNTTPSSPAVRALSPTERYLNQQSGLLGVSGITSDSRRILELKEQGDPRATLAHEMFIYHLQGTIGHFAACLGGIDALALTATISERDPRVRRDLLANLSFLGFQLDPDKNTACSKPTTPVNVAVDNSKPIFIVSSDESGNMLCHAEKLL